MVKYPFGPADLLTQAFAATINLSVDNANTYVQCDVLTGATTVNVTATGAALENGALLYLEVPNNGTARDVTAGTGLSTGIAGTINKTKVATYVMRNGTFVQIGLNTIN